MSKRKRLGVGAALRFLTGAQTADQLDCSTIENRPIRRIWIEEKLFEENCLRIAFSGGGELRLKDEAQSCCESRYMTTDDDLTSFREATIRCIRLADGSTEESEDGEQHDVQFLRIETSKGTLVIANHNEHNGYYGGFSVEARLLLPPTEEVS